MPKKDFETLRKEFWAKRDELTNHVEQFNKLSQKYPAERFEGSAARLYNSYSVILRDLYDYVEELYKENTELRKEIDQLKKQ
jgi:cell division protein FtsB